jgi:hypothetical protein
VGGGAHGRPSAGAARTVTTTGHGGHRRRPVGCDLMVWRCPGWVSQAKGRWSAIAPRTSTPGVASVGSLSGGVLTAALPQHRLGNAEFR